MLPIELAIQILKHVNSIHMMKTMALVCSRWNRISTDNDVWRSLFVTRWGRPRKQSKVYSEKDWKVLYKSRLNLNQNWNQGKVW